jgi:hypothetical protein
MPMAAGNRTHDRRVQRPPVFAAWLAIRHRGPVCQRWRTFPAFYAEVGQRPSWRHLLMRADISRPFEPDNAAWRAWAMLSKGETPVKYTEQLRQAAAKLKIVAHGLEDPHQTELRNIADQLLANALELDVAGVPDGEDLN